MEISSPKTSNYQESQVKKFIDMKVKQQNDLMNEQHAIKQDYFDTRTNLDLINEVATRRCNDITDSINNEIARLEGFYAEVTDTSNKNLNYLKRQFDHLVQDRISMEKIIRMSENRITTLEMIVGVDLELPVLEEHEISLDV